MTDSRICGTEVQCVGLKPSALALAAVTLLACTWVFAPSSVPCLQLPDPLPGTVPAPGKLLCRMRAAATALCKDLLIARSDSAPQRLFEDLHQPPDHVHTLPSFPITKNPEAKLRPQPASTRLARLPCRQPPPSSSVLMMTLQGQPKRSLLWVSTVSPLVHKGLN